MLRRALLALSVLLAPPAWAARGPSLTANVAPTIAPYPAHLAAVQDAGFGVSVTRISGDAGQPIDGLAGGKWTRDARHHYSRDQPESHDGRFVLIEQKGGTPSRVILDARTWRPVVGDRGTVPRSKTLAAAYECRWLPGRDHTMVGWDKTRRRVTVFDPIADREEWSLPIAIGDPDFGFISEGTVSDSGDVIALSTHWPQPWKSGRRDTVILVDLVKRQVGPYNAVWFDHPTSENGEIDNVSISADGLYVGIKAAGVPEYLRVYKRGYGLTANKRTLDLSPQIMAANGLRMKDAKGDRYGYAACMSHADMNLHNKRAVMVGGLRDAGSSNVCSDAEKKRLGAVIMVYLDDGTHEHISAGSERLGGLREAEDEHTSGRAYELHGNAPGKAGWHLVTYASSPGRQFDDEMVLYRLDGKDFRRLGRTGTDGSTYRSEAHGVPNRDGSRVYYASNNLRSCGPCGPSISDVKTYVVEVPRTE